MNELNPIGRWKEEFNNARLCSTIVSTAGVSSKPADFMWEEEPTKPPTSEELTAKLTNWAKGNKKV